MKDLVIRIDRKVFAVFLLLFGLYFAFTHEVKVVHASVNPSGLTGQYGCMMNRSTNAFSALMTGHSGKEGSNAISYLDYSNNTTSAVITQNQYFNSLNAVTSVGVVSGTFTETAFSGVPNTYKIVSSYSNGFTFAYYAMPVNGGKTVLITSGDDGTTVAPWSGVCQQI